MLETPLGNLTVGGQGLQVSELSVASGQVQLSGKIEYLQYAENRQSGGSLLARVFRRLPAPPPSPWTWEATAREDPQYRPFDADAYFIGGTKGALSLPRLHQFSYDGASNWHKPLQMEIPAVDPALPHKMQLKHFVKVVRREVEPVVTPADNVKTLTLLNAIKEAAETGQLVEL